MRPWLVLRQGDRLRWGGDLRRRYLFDGLVERGAWVQEDDRPQPIRLAIRARSGRRFEVWRRRTRVASSELLAERQLRAVTTRGRGAVVDVHDDQILQSQALGIPLAPDHAAAARARLEDNLRVFRDVVVPSKPFSELVGLDPDRVVVGSSGTDTSVIRAEPWPDRPAVGFISGAAPRRGIESLIEAVRELRSERSDLTLRLWLAATGAPSLQYLDDLRLSVAKEAWITIDSLAYRSLSPAFGMATTLVIPTPAHEYWDSVAPVKLFDAMAAGRPTVTTPRTETARLVRAHDIGVVATGDRPEDLAAAIAIVLRDATAARRQGANARRLAETTYDWRILGPQLAESILERW